MNLIGESTNKKYLIIAHAGDSSLHTDWMEPKEFRTFHIYLNYYGDLSGRYMCDCDYYSEDKGGKGPVIQKIIKSLGKDLEQYQAVWIPDEHIRADAFSINRMFHIFTDQELWMAQPALMEVTHASRSASSVHPEYILRFIRFDQMVAPIFSIEALKTCFANSKNFDTSESGSIMDIKIPAKLQYPRRKTAVIDATPLRLMRPEPAVPALELPEQAASDAGEMPEREAGNAAVTDELPVPVPHEEEAPIHAMPEENGLQPEAHESPIPLVRKSSRRRSRKSGRFAKKSRKVKIMKKFKKKLVKKSKTKLVRQNKKVVRLPKPFLKQKSKTLKGKKKGKAA